MSNRRAQRERETHIYVDIYKSTSHFMANILFIQIHAFSFEFHKKNNLYSSEAQETSFYAVFGAGKAFAVIFRILESLHKILSMSSIHKILFIQFIIFPFQSFDFNCFFLFKKMECLIFRF